MPGVVQLCGAAGLFSEDVVNVLEGLFKHGRRDYSEIPTLEVRSETGKEWEGDGSVRYGRTAGGAKDAPVQGANQRGGERKGGKAKTREISHIRSK